jgi:sorting nexin-8
MSLFGTTPPNEPSSLGDSGLRPSRVSLFDDDGPTNRSGSDSLFNDDELSGSGAGSPWDMPTPRKQQSRADLIRGLLAGVQVPDSYVEAFDHALQEDGRGGKVSAAGISKTLAAAKLGADEQALVMSIISPNGDEVELARDSFNVLLALIALAQEGETVSLDGVDERRRSEYLTNCIFSSSRFYQFYISDCLTFFYSSISPRPLAAIGLGWLSTPNRPPACVLCFPVSIYDKRVP